jgi:DNA-binding NarL/FixJ family response regulator
VHAGAARTATRSRAFAAACEGSTTIALADLEEVTALSPREREVAQLAARGHTNRAIAEALSVSVRTVESHLYNVFAKMGMTQRAELGAVLLGPQDRPDH